MAKHTTAYNSTFASIYAANAGKLRFSPTNVCYTADAMFKSDFTLTKKHIGILLFAVGALGVAAILLMDRLNIGRESGLGPAQQAALIVLALLALLGLTLIPLGDTPA
jgi:hypothetical protein